MGFSQTLEPSSSGIYCMCLCWFGSFVIEYSISLVVYTLDSTIHTYLKYSGTLMYLDCHVYILLCRVLQHFLAYELFSQGAGSLSASDS